MKNIERKTPSVICLKCGRQIRARCFNGDWLNDICPVKHKNKNGNQCDGWLYPVKNLIEE